MIDLKIISMESLFHVQQTGQAVITNSHTPLQALNGIDDLISYIYIKSHLIAIVGKGLESRELCCYWEQLASCWNQRNLWGEHREKSEEAGSRRESNPRHFWLEPPVLCHKNRTTTHPYNPLYIYSQGNLLVVAAPCCLVSLYKLEHQAHTLQPNTFSLWMHSTVRKVVKWHFWIFCYYVYKTPVYGGWAGSLHSANLSISHLDVSNPNISISNLEMICNVVVKTCYKSAKLVHWNYQEVSLTGSDSWHSANKILQKPCNPQ